MQVLIAMGVRLNGRGKRSAAPGSVLEYMKTGELHLRTPAGDIRRAGLTGVLRIWPSLPRYGPYRYFGVRHNGRGKRSVAPWSVSGLDADSGLAAS